VKTEALLAAGGYRPRYLDEIVGQKEILDPASGAFFLNALPSARLAVLSILLGIPLTGKTILADAMPNSL